MPAHRSVRKLALLCASAVCPLVSGCTTPQLGLFQSHDWKPDPWKGPGVQVLVNHVTCQLIRDFRENETSWSRLADYHFVGAVNLALTVTNSQSEGFSANVVHPTTTTGKGISPVYQTATATQPVTSATYNWTLAVGQQASGSQANALTLNYSIDMQRIAVAADKDFVEQRDRELVAKLEVERSKTGDKSLPAADQIREDMANARIANVELVSSSVDGLRAMCLPKSPAPDAVTANGKAPLPANFSEIGLHQLLKEDLLLGDIGLASTINNGLGTLDAVQSVNVYGSGGPTIPADALGLIGPRVGRGPFAPAFAGGAPGGGKPQAAAQASAGAGTSFSGAITFTVQSGVSGGPSWNLLLLKVGSGGGGSSGGGGAGGGPINLSRQVTDALTVTFAPTCRATDETPISFINFNQPSSGTGNTSIYWLKESSPPTDSKYVATLVISGLPGGTPSGYVQFAPKPGAKGPALTPLVAAITWTTFTSNGNDVTLVGVVNNPSNGSPVGSIVLTGTVSGGNGSALAGSLTGHFTADITRILANDVPTQSYWLSLPSCDVATGSYLQGVLADVFNRNESARIAALLGQ